MFFKDFIIRLQCIWAVLTKRYIIVAGFNKKDGSGTKYMGSNFTNDDNINEIFIDTVVDVLQDVKRTKNYH